MEITSEDRYVSGDALGIIHDHVSKEDRDVAMNVPVDVDGAEGASHVSGSVARRDGYLLTEPGAVTGRTGAGEGETGEEKENEE